MKSRRRRQRVWQSFAVCSLLKRINNQKLDLRSYNSVGVYSIRIVRTEYGQQNGYCDERVPRHPIGMIIPRR